MSARRGQKPWAPADINESGSEAVTILRYWDVTTPPPKNAKLGAFRRGKRYRRISLEMHRVPREADHNSLELADIFPDHVHDQNRNHSPAPAVSPNNIHMVTCDRAFFRISKYVPIKSNNLADDATILSDVSARTKDMYSKPDHEWRTKFLLQVSRVAITEIKNEKEVFFEAWDSGEVIARSLVFKQVSQAKEFSYDLERLANEDPELNQSRPSTPIDNGPPRVIESNHATTNTATTNTTIGRKKFGRRKNKEGRQSTPPSTPSHPKESSPHTPRTTDTGQSTITRSRTERSRIERSTTAPMHNLSRNKRGCCQKCCQKFVHVLASIFHFFGVAIALALFLYSIAVYSVRPNPQSKTAGVLFLWSVLIAWTHGTGIMGTGSVCCGAVCFIRTSVGLAIVSILLNLALLVIFTVREDDIFTYLRNHHDQLFLSVDVINVLNTHVLWIYCFMMAGSLAEMMRICMLQKLKRDILRRRNEGRFNDLSAPLLNDEELQASRTRLDTF